MQEWIELAEELAEESGELIRGYFASGVAVEQKADASPVTAADREAEALMRRRIEARFPEHRVVGEEFGASGGEDSDYQWLLDPIDGTRSFVHGVPLFGTLIALLEKGRPILGVIHLPIAEEMLVGAMGRKTTLNGEAVSVRETRDLAAATVLCTDTAELWLRGYGPAFLELQERAATTRGWGDCYGHFMVAAGRADIMLDPVLNPWDIAALKPCVEGAGGRLTGMDGTVSDLGEDALSSNGHLHDAVLAILTAKRA